MLLNNKIYFVRPLLSTLLLTLCTLSVSMYSHADLEELDDQILEEQTAKAGITIDLAFKLSIGQIYIDHTDREQDGKRNNLLTTPPPRIEYHQGKN